MKNIMLRICLMILRLFIYAGIIFLLIRVGTYAYGFGYQLYSNKGVEESPGRDLAIVIYEDQSVEEIALMLEKFGLIRDQRVFVIQEFLSRYHGEIIPGDYVLNTSYSGNQMIEILTGHTPGEVPDDNNTSTNM